MATKQDSKPRSPLKKKTPTQDTEQPDKEVIINKDKQTFVNKPFQPPLWVDRTRIALREDVPIAALIFYSVVPDPDKDVNEETVRIMTTVEHLKKLVDLLCRQLDYYPERANDNDK